MYRYRTSSRLLEFLQVSLIIDELCYDGMEWSTKHYSLASVD